MFPPYADLRRLVQQLPSQDNIKCCTASASLLAAEITMASNGNRMNFSRLYVYYMTRKMQNRLTEHGAELKATLEALKVYGASSESLWPFSPNRVERAPHTPAVEFGVHYKLRSYVPTTTDHFKELLNNDTPVILGMVTGKLFWELRGTFEEQAYKPVNGTDNRQSTGHAVTLVGYDDRIKGGSWIIANSLGPRWGHYGYGAIPYSCNINIGEAYVITDFAGNTPGKNISEI